jgi:hypothetical protein
MWRIFFQGHILSITGDSLSCKSWGLFLVWVEQVERFACLYTSHVTNLCYYSPDKSYRTTEDFMPHELEGIGLWLLDIASWLTLLLIDLQHHLLNNNFHQEYICIWVRGKFGVGIAHQCSIGALEVLFTWWWFWLWCQHLSLAHAYRWTSTASAAWKATTYHATWVDLVLCEE